MDRQSAVLTARIPSRVLHFFCHFQPKGVALAAFRSVGDGLIRSIVVLQCYPHDRIAAFCYAECVAVAPLCCELPAAKLQGTPSTLVVRAEIYPFIGVYGHPYAIAIAADRTVR